MSPTRRQCALCHHYRVVLLQDVHILKSAGAGADAGTVLFFAAAAYLLKPMHNGEPRWHPLTCTLLDCKASFGMTFFSVRSLRFSIGEIDL
jgi:hypothetical protein